MAQPNPTITQHDVVTIPDVLASRKTSPEAEDHPNAEEGTPQEPEVLDGNKSHSPRMRPQSSSGQTFPTLILDNPPPEPESQILMSENIVQLHYLLREYFKLSQGYTAELTGLLSELSGMPLTTQINLSWIGTEPSGENITPT